MMREILFKGKRLDNGEWITGHLLRYDDGRARIVPNNTDIFCFEKDESIIQTVAHRIAPETVGQYTGFVDKNGKKIFEGDIVSICNSKTFFFIVYWNHAVKSFILKSTVNGVNGIDCNVLNSTQDIEVVGNIYDNPELIKDGE
jgi:uncharacterized phage protein (TIGR01671 family)